MKISKLIMLTEASQKLRVVSVRKGYSMYSVKWTGTKKDIPNDLLRRKIKCIRTIKNDVLEIELEDKC